jgi:hypothetical protein
MEYWFVVAGMVIYVSTRDAERQPIMKRIGKILASGLLALGMSAELAVLLGTSETIAAVAIIAFGMIVLDVATELFANPAFVKELARNLLGGRGDGKP